VKKYINMMVAGKPALAFHQIYAPAVSAIVLLQSVPENEAISPCSFALAGNWPEHQNKKRFFVAVGS
jgi:hypothetical protein